MAKLRKDIPLEKILFLSDLDGTLLQSDATVSLDDQERLETLICRGVQFSIATARSASSACKILPNLPLKLPVILMNGVCMTELQSGRIISKEIMSYEQVQKIICLCKKYHVIPFVHRLTEESMHTYYETLPTAEMQEFVSARSKDDAKRFQQISDLSLLPADHLVYINLIDTYEHLKDFYAEISTWKDLHTAFYQDVYLKNQWFLEIFHKNASKENALYLLKKRIGAEYVICFGDSLNDLPLFRGSDYACAVGNAVSDLKNQADEIIGTNQEHAVTRWMEQYVNDITQNTAL